MKSRDMWTVIGRLDYNLRFDFNFMEKVGDVLGKHLFIPTFESVSKI